MHTTIEHAILHYRACTLYSMQLYTIEYAKYNMHTRKHTHYTTDDLYSCIKYLIHNSVITPSLSRLIMYFLPWVLFAIFLWITWSLYFACISCLLFLQSQRQQPAKCRHTHTQNAQTFVQWFTLSRQLP